MMMGSSGFGNRALTSLQLLVSSRQSLDIAYSTMGSGSDETLAGLLSWLQWALFLVFLINVLEAGVSLRLQVPPSPQLVKPNGLSQPPGSLQAASQSSSPMASQTSTPPAKVASKYDPQSPLKASLEAASRSVSGTFTSSSPSQGSPLNPLFADTRGGTHKIPAGRRMPSSTPLLSNGGASPLAAYLARRGVSSSASGESLVQDGGADLSYDSDVAAGEYFDVARSFKIQLD